MIGFLTECCLLCTLLTNSPLQRYESQEPQLGTIIRITVYAENEPLARKAMQSAFDRIEKLNLLLSDYDSNSELRRLCDKATPGQPVKVSHDLFTVLKYAQDVSKQTEGAFDVTVGPVVKLWRRARRRKRLPEKDRLQNALKSVGYQKLVLNACDKTVVLKHQGMLLDLGAIAKGYMADQALLVLNHHGITRAVIDAGGDLVAGDPPPGQPGWRIGIAKQNEENHFEMTVSLKNAAVATSGDAYQFVEIDGKRYSHIINPQTGIGLTTPRSVTVIAKDGMTADAWASAISVLGPKPGLKLIQQHKAMAAYISQLDQHQQKQIYQSPDFDRR